MQNVIAVRTGVIDDLLLEWCKKEEITQVCVRQEQGGHEGGQESLKDPVVRAACGGGAAVVEAGGGGSRAGSSGGERAVY